MKECTEARRFDVIVVGAGHAGCEAALASARIGCTTALFSLDRHKIAAMPCNPSVGGPGKGHLVREIDALGGEMARNTDRTSVQIRLLNTGKGPAVRSLRAQSDKHAYSRAMATMLALEPMLAVIEASVDDIVIEREARGRRVAGIRTSTGDVYEGAAVVLTTGTFLKGRIIIGQESHPGGREGEFPADALSRSLDRAGFTLHRLKTGTPPRVDRASIDFSRTTVQHGSDVPLFFSHRARRAYEHHEPYAPSAREPIVALRDREPGPGTARGAEPSTSRSVSEDDATASPSRACRAGITGAEPWRHQLDCYLLHTNAETHDIIRRNLHRAPMYNGAITAAGPRYCPSIEAKIVRFADKPAHQLFLEPEGWDTDEIYVQGANTSLPADVQLAMLRTIPAMARAEIVRVGYAIEYDSIPATQVDATLESKPIRGLFLAGQIIGTTGYEEAASLGIMAGINAACSVVGRSTVVLRRDQAYIGVLIDDLVTRDLDEPYRMHTSQAEYRLLLREDSAEARLSAIGHDLGLVDETDYDDIRQRLILAERTLAHLELVRLKPNDTLNSRLMALGARPLSSPVSGYDALRRADITLVMLQQLGLDCGWDLPAEVAREVETMAKYAGYVERQEAEVQRVKRLEHRVIPGDTDYQSVKGLRTESREKLERVRPLTIGQAGRIAGVAPADVAVLLFHLERERRARPSA